MSKCILVCTHNNNSTITLIQNTTSVVYPRQEQVWLNDYSTVREEWNSHILHSNLTFFVLPIMNKDVLGISEKFTIGQMFISFNHTKLIIKQET